MLVSTGVRMSASEMGMGTAPTATPAAVEAATMPRAIERLRLSSNSATSCRAAWMPSGRSRTVVSISALMPVGATKPV